MVFEFEIIGRLSGHVCLLGRGCQVKTGEDDFCQCVTSDHRVCNDEVGGQLVG